MSDHDLHRQAACFLSDPTARRHPEDFYRRLVIEAPVLRVGPVWLVSGYAELKQLACHPHVAVDPTRLGVQVTLSPVPTLAALIARTMAVRDGADHRRLKQLAMSAFSAARIAATSDVLAETIDALLEAPLAAGHFDVVADLAVPLPVAVSCALLDIPPADRPQVQEWTTLFSAAAGQSLSDLHRRELTERADALLAYIDDLCKQRRGAPGDDLISELARAAEHGRLDADELRAFAVMLFANGLETLTSGLGLAAWELVRRPYLRARVGHHPEIALPVFEEVLRLGTPVRASARTVTADVDLGGQRLRRGDVAVLFYAAANRDPRVFSEPDRLDPGRTGARHHGFGHGVHFCLGASVSRVAGEHVVRALARCRDLTTPVTDDTVARKPSFVFNGLTALPVTFTPATTPLAMAG